MDAIVNSFILVFAGEMGDKTQLATVGLAAKFSSIFLVTIGSTLGMMVSNALAVAFGQKLLQRLSMNWVRRIACILFLIFGIAIIIG